MSRRTKLIILSLFLLLLAIPAWHTARNWNPPNPLHFRLLSRQMLPVDEFGRRQERLEIEALNTSTAPIRLDFATVKYRNVPEDPFAPSVFADGTVVPAGGTARGTTRIMVPKGESTQPEPEEIRYFHASTVRYQILSRYISLLDYLPESLQEHLWLELVHESTNRLDTSP